MPEKVLSRSSSYFTLISSAESYRFFVKVYNEHALTEPTCKKWLARFKGVDFVFEEEERPMLTFKFEDEELESLLNEGCGQTQEEHVETLEMTQAAIAKCSKKKRDTLKSKEIGC